jgi:hypothetical protein
MGESVLSLFKEWETYYLIVGTAAGALTGLQFVVLTLITKAGVLRGSEEALAAFSSPNVAHFSAALLVSAIATAPSHGTGAPAFAFGLCGVLGLVYSLSVLTRARRQRDHRPVLEDWRIGLGLAGASVPSRRSNADRRDAAAADWLSETGH